MNSDEETGAFVLARLDEEQVRAEAMEHFIVYDDTYYSCPATRTGPQGDLEWGEEHCQCQLAGRKAKRLREVAALRSVVADCTKRLAYPANAPLCNLARRTIAGVAAIWNDHPDYRES